MGPPSALAKGWTISVAGKGTSISILPGEGGKREKGLQGFAFLPLVEGRGRGERRKKEDKGGPRRWTGEGWSQTDEFLFLKGKSVGVKLKYFVILYWRK